MLPKRRHFTASWCDCELLTAANRASRSQVTGHFSSREGEEETHERETIKQASRRQRLQSPTTKVTFALTSWAGGGNHCRSRGSVFLNFLPASLALLPRRCHTFIFGPADGRTGRQAACGRSRNNKSSIVFFAFLSQTMWATPISKKIQ